MNNSENMPADKENKDKDYGYIINQAIADGRWAKIVEESKARMAKIKKEEEEKRKKLDLEKDKE